MKNLWRAAMKVILPKPPISTCPDLSSKEDREVIAKRLDRVEAIVKYFDHNASLIRREP